MSLKIGIVGKMGSGKTTTANFIKSYDNTFYKESFSNKLKEIASDLFNMTTKDRELLIKIGAKMRDIDEDVWAKYTLKSCLSFKNVVIDDVRYLNEYFLLRTEGWKIIKLEISSELQKKRLIETYPDTYEAHFKYINDITEEEAVNLDDSYFDLVINVDTQDVKNEIITFLNKNN